MHERRTGRERRQSLADVESSGIQDQRKQAGRRQEERWKRFGNWLRERRGALPGRPTQQTVASAAGMTARQWSRLENGTSGTDFQTIPQIASAIGTSEAETYWEAGFVPPTAPAQCPVVLTPLSQREAPIISAEEVTRLSSLESRVEELELRLDALSRALILASAAGANAPSS